MALTLPKRDKQARILIFTLSAVVFAAVVLLSRVKLEADLSFDVHLFARINAFLNSGVTLLLLAGLFYIKRKNVARHRAIMLTALLLSSLFLVSYICHHLLAGDTRFGDLDRNGVLTAFEKSEAGSLRYLYYVILFTHIPLAGIILPFILFTTYRALTGEYARHRKLARITWPIWLYVAITGVVVYLMISPYY